MQSPETEILTATRVNSGRTLDELSRLSPVLVVFLRHAGCPFCREALADLQKKRASIENLGTRIVLVHMMTDPEAAAFFKRYGLDDVDRLSDPEQQVYRAFGLKRAAASQVMGPAIWWRGFKTTFLRGNLPGKPVGDIFQLPGTFLLVDGRIVRRFAPDSSADRPDYEDLAACPVPPAE